MLKLINHTTIYKINPMPNRSELGVIVSLRLDFALRRSKHERDPMT